MTGIRDGKNIRNSLIQTNAFSTSRQYKEVDKIMKRSCEKYVRNLLIPKGSEEQEAASEMTRNPLKISSDIQLLVKLRHNYPSSPKRANVKERNERWVEYLYGNFEPTEPGCSN